MKRIWADFNARTMSGLIVLNTRGSQESIKEVGGVADGETVLLTDNELTVPAVVMVGHDSGFTFANPDWNRMRREDDGA